MLQKSFIFKNLLLFFYCFGAVSADEGEFLDEADISERALAFTAFNAALAAVDPDRLELLAGSLLEPVAGRRFDLIVTNPPFVLTPPAVRKAGLPLMEYRDAGRPVLPSGITLRVKFIRMLFFSVPNPCMLSSSNAYRISMIVLLTILVQLIGIYAVM